MAVMTERLRVQRVHYGVALKTVGRPARRSTVRPIMVLSIGLILASMVLVFAMFLDLVPVNFFTAFVGLAMVATGGVLALIFCGEI